MTGPKRLEVIEVADPVKSPGQVMVRITKVTICGSDLHEFRARTPRSFPWTPGNPAHECLGMVIDCDPKTGFHKDEMVLVRPPGGGLKEIAAVQPSDLISVEGSGLDPEVAVMAQLLGPVVHCVKRLGEVRGRSIFILGQGPAGLTITNVLSGTGAGPIVTCDLIQERLDESEKRGAHLVIKGGPDLPSRLDRIVEGGLFDIVIEAVGEDETIAMVPKLAKQLGLVMLFGIPGETAILHPREFFGKQLHLTTSEFPQPEDFVEALDMMTGGRIDMAGMITHRFPFDEVQRAFDLADNKSEGVLRVVLEMEK